MKPEVTPQPMSRAERRRWQRFGKKRCMKDADTVTNTSIAVYKPVTTKSRAGIEYTKMKRVFVPKAAYIKAMEKVQNAKDSQK